MFSTSELNNKIIIDTLRLKIEVKTFKLFVTHPLHYSILEIYSLAENDTANLAV